VRVADFQLDLPRLLRRFFIASVATCLGATGGSGRVIRKFEQPQLFEVLDRILDKGIVIDPWIRLSMAGVDFLAGETRIVVASVEIHLKYADPAQMVLPFAPPRRAVLDAPAVGAAGSRRTLEIVRRNPFYQPHHNATQRKNHHESETDV